MAHQELNRAHVGAGFQETDREGVRQRMRRDRLGNVASPLCFLADLFHGILADMHSGDVAWKEPRLWLSDSPPVRQTLQQLGREHDIPVFLPLALFHTVPLGQYIETVRLQRPRQGWLTRGAFAKAFSGMVITEHLPCQIGPAVSSANSLLLYGKPGDGKTFLIESLNNLRTGPVFVPYALECQGNIIQVYDPVYHQKLDDERERLTAPLALEPAHDRR